MPRRARIVVPGIAWHVIQRGNNRSACFYIEDDYHKYLEILKEQAEKYNCLDNRGQIIGDRPRLIIRLIRK